MRMLLGASVVETVGTWSEVQKAIEDLDKNVLVDIGVRSGIGKKTALGRMGCGALAKRTMTHAKKELGK